MGNVYSMEEKRIMLVAAGRILNQSSTSVSVVRLLHRQAAIIVSGEILAPVGIGQSVGENARLAKPIVTPECCVNRFQGAKE